MSDLARAAVVEAGGTGKEKIAVLLRNSDQEGFLEQAPAHLSAADQLWVVGIVAGEEDPADLSVNYAVHGDGQTNALELRLRARGEYREGQKMFSAIMEGDLITEKKEDKMWRSFEAQVLKNAAIRLAEFEGRFVGGYIVSHVRETDRIMGGIIIPDVLRDTYLNGFRTGGFLTPEEQSRKNTPEQVEEMRSFSINTANEFINANAMLGGTIARWLPLRRGLRSVFNKRKTQAGWRHGNIW